MKSFKLSVTAVLVFLAFAVGQVYAGSASESDYGGQAEMDQSTMMEQGQNTLKASDVMGKTVNDQQGQEIGTVDDLVIGSQGQVEYVVLSPTGDLAKEDQLIPLPWQIIQTQSGQEGLTAAVEMQQLKDAPSISSDQMQQLSDQEMQSRVQGYYGVESQQDHMMKDDMMEQHQMMKKDHMDQQEEMMHQKDQMHQEDTQE